MKPGNKKSQTMTLTESRLEWTESQMVEGGQEELGETGGGHIVLVRNWGELSWETAGAEEVEGMWTLSVWVSVIREEKEYKYILFILLVWWQIQILMIDDLCLCYYTDGIN